MTISTEPEPTHANSAANEAQSKIRPLSERLVDSFVLGFFRPLARPSASLYLNFAGAKSNQCPAFAQTTKS